MVDVLRDATPGWVENKNLSERADLNPYDRTLGTSEKSEFDSKDHPTPSLLTFMHLHFAVLLRAEKAPILVIRMTLLSQPY